MRAVWVVTGAALLGWYWPTWYWPTWYWLTWYWLIWFWALGEP